jgi:PAS domain S-box-containing protein
LEAERARLAEAQEIARLGSWHWTREGGVRVTEQWGKILSVGVDGVTDPVAVLRRALVPEERERLDERVREIENNHMRTSSGNWRIRRPDGAIGVLHVTARWQFDAHGTRISGAGTFQDVTEQATAQEEIARQRALLEESQRLAHVGSWELDLAMNVVRWSDEMYRIAGLPPGSGTMTRDDAGALVHAQDRAYVSDRIASAVASGEQEVDYEHRLMRADGAARVVLTRVRVFRNTDGSVARLVGSTQDMTDRRQLEDQFRQTQKMEALGLLAGGIAHDFNNLLTAILGGVDLAREEVPADSVIANDLKDVRHAALRAAELTRQLLAFSRKQPHRPRVLDLSETVRRSEGLLRRLLPHDAITLDVLPGETPAVLRADATQIEQVLVNLVVNARDAIEAPERQGETTGVITVEVSMREEREPRVTTAGADVEPGWYATLIVRDTGVGMSAATMQRIFEPFFTTKAEGYGTGLGLATVFGIVVQAGGGVDVESTPGAGSVFTVLLPAVEEPLADAEAEASAATMRGSETVLLVEDERVVRETATRILERHGYRVLTARHGADALLIWGARAADIDVVITDVRMPTMGGRALVERLRTERPDVAVVVMSGYTSEHDAAEAAMLQQEMFLEKPFTAESLLTIVRGALDHARL